MTEITVNSEDEWDNIEDAGKGIVLLLTAPSWCNPCRQFEPHWDKAVKTEALEEYVFVKINMGETREDTADNWAYSRFDVQQVPTVMLLTDEVRYIKSRAVISLIREITA